MQFPFNTLRPRQNGRHFPVDIFKCVFLNENVWIPIEFLLKFVPKGPINNIPAMVQIMAWRRPGDKPLSEPMVVSLPTHICVIRPQWVKYCFKSSTKPEFIQSCSHCIPHYNVFLYRKWTNIYNINMIHMCKYIKWMIMLMNIIYTVKSLYKAHFGRQLNCWSRRCSRSIACRRCPNYIFILHLTPGFNGLGKGNYKTWRETFNFWDLVCLILEILQYIYT